MAYTNIAVVGAGGNLGKIFMQAVLASTQPKFNVTVLARPTSTYVAPRDDVKVVKHDLTDQAAVAESLRGIDAVLLMQGVDKDTVIVSKAITEAAIAAGVKMIMPGDFGGKETPIYSKVIAHKILIRTFLEEKAKEGKITYTAIKNGAFFDQPLKASWEIDYSEKKAILFDEGTQKFNTTMYASVARAAVSILRSPAEFANKVLYIHDFRTTQREVLEIVESEVGGTFEMTSLNTEEMGKKALEGLARGERNRQNIAAGIRSGVWGQEGAADWDEDDDSERLGLEKKDLREEIKRKIAAGM